MAVVVVIVVIICQLLLGEAQLLALHTLCVHIPIDPWWSKPVTILWIFWEIFQKFLAAICFPINQSIKTDFYSAVCCKWIRVKFLSLQKI